MTELYDGVTPEKWLEELYEHRGDNRKLLYALWALWGTPETFLDIGCGEGDLVLRSRQLGIEAYGVDQLVNFQEGSWFDRGWYDHADLREPWSIKVIDNAPSNVNLVICWEVAEHIPEEFHGVLCDTCANHLIRGNKSYLVFTSAHPGQGGTEHIAARPQIYWRDMFHKRGLNFMQNLSTQVALAWNNLQTGLYWMPANVQVFERG